MPTIAGSAAAVLMSATLVVFGWIGWSARRAATLDDYVAAPNSQPVAQIALSFFASGMGAWILFAPPEVGAGIGFVGVIGYAVGAAAPPALFGLAGGRIRALLPEGHSLTSFAGTRFGTGFGTYVSWIGVAYMLVFLTAELTAIGAIVAIATPLDARIAIVAVAAVTAVYTATGGLRASLETDRWQSWAVIVLAALGIPALLVAAPPPLQDAAPLARLDRLGVEVALTLVIAVAAANVFHEGYWQRVRSAADDATLARGGLLAGALIVPLVLGLGAIGVVASASGIDVGSPPAPFFALASALPGWFAAVILVLGLSLVASSIDTLQNGLVSLASRGRPTPFGISTARLITVAVTIPPALIALQGYSVLRLFLIADLICAATAVPVLSGLARRTTPRAAIAGAAAGPLGAILPLWITTGSLAETIRRVTFEGAIPTLAPFLGALVASAAVTIIGARLPVFRNGSGGTSN